MNGSRPHASGNNAYEYKYQYEHEPPFRESASLKIVKSSALASLQKRTLPRGELSECAHLFSVWGMGRGRLGMGQQAWGGVTQTQSFMDGGVSAPPTHLHT